MTFLTDEVLLYSKQELEFREHVKDFVLKEITPIAQKIEEENYFPIDILKKMGKKGFTGLMVPEKYGGQEKSLMYQLIAGEEISVESPALTMGFGASCTLSAIPILRFGSEEQKLKYLVPLAKGEKIGALAITEPNVGSDTAGMETKAEWDEREQCWILKGEKRFITNGSVADQIVTFAITNSEVESKSGMSAFIIETKWQGFEVVRDYSLMGRHGVRNTHFKLNEIKIPPENLLGKVNQGFFILMDELDTERVGIAAEALGCMRKPFKIAVNHSMNRVQFGKPISRFEGISFKIADMATVMRAARLMTITAARMIEKSIPATKEATMAKLFATEAAVKVTDMAIQILGGEGYVKDYSGIEKFYRDARLGTIGGGTSEIMRFLIQRQVYIEEKRGNLEVRENTFIDFEKLMNNIPKGFRPERAENLIALIQFEFSDKNNWFLEIRNNECLINKGTVKDATIIVQTSSETWKKIMLGQLDPIQAMMAEEIKFTTENMDLLMKFTKMFKFTPELFFDD